MLDSNAKTGLKIGGSVSIIILLLGIAVLFGINQMSKVSQEVIEISEEYVPLNGILSDIRILQSNQAQNFENILRIHDSGSKADLQNLKEEFWMTSGVIESDISRGKAISQTGIEISASGNEKTMGNQIHRNTRPNILTFSL